MKKLFSSILLLTCLLSACTSDQLEVDYLAVKLVDSEMWSIVDVNSGEVLYEDEFKEEPSKIDNDIFYVMTEDTLYNFYNVKNVKTPINKTPYKEVTGFNEDDIALVTLPEGTINIIDKNCKVIADLGKEIRSCEGFAKGTATVCNYEGKFGIINTKGEYIIKPIYDRIRNFAGEDFTIAGKKNKDDVYDYTAIDRNGKTLFKLSSTQYEEIGRVSEGYFPVCTKNGDKYDVYFLNKKGEKSKAIGKISEAYLLFSYTCHDGLTVFREGDLYGIKNIDGEVVIRPKYDFLELLPDGNYRAEKNDKYGIISKDDEVLFPIENEYLVCIGKNRFIVESGKVKSLVNLEGNDVSTRNFSDYSSYSASSIQSNYFNAESVVSFVFKLFDHSSCHGVTSDNTLNNFRYLLTKSVYSYDGEYVLNERDYSNNIDLLYAFEDGLVLDEYEFYYGHSIQTGKKFNYSAKLTCMAMRFSLSDYGETAKVKFTETFEKKLQKDGYVSSEKGYFKSKSGNYVGVAYDGKDVSIWYHFNDKFLLDLTRK